MGKSETANVAYAERDERGGPPGHGGQVFVALGHVAANAEAITLPAPPLGQQQDPEETARGIVAQFCAASSTGRQNGPARAGPLYWQVVHHP